MYIRWNCVHSFPKLLVVYWLGHIVLHLGLRLGLGTGNGYFISFFFFFPYLKLTNTLVLLFWADDMLNYVLIYNPGI